VHFEVEFGLHHYYVPTEEDILNILGASKMSKTIEDDSKISEVANHI
jgi:hypothetical protein